MKIRPASAYQVRAAAKSAALLADALTCAQVANCPKLARAIRFAVGSAKGARTHILKRQAANPLIRSSGASNREICGKAQGVGVIVREMQPENVHFAGKAAFWCKTGQYA